MSEFPPPLPPDRPAPSPSDAGSGSNGSPPTDTLPEVLPPTIPGRLGGNFPPHRAGAVLGLGIASLGVLVLDFLGLIHPMCCCGASMISIGLAIPSIVMANADLAAMGAGRMDPAGRSSTSGGRTCAIIALVIAGLMIIGAVIAVIAGLALFGAMSAAGNRP